MLKLGTFGGLSLIAEGRTLTGAATQRRPLALLAILAIAADRGVSRDRILSLLWPESDETRGRRVLAQTMYAIRRDLGDAAVVLGTVDLRLNTEHVTADVTELERAAGNGELERVVTLYRGPFLDGVHLTDAPEFEQWIAAERWRLAAIAQQALERLAREAAGRGDAEVAVGWWRRLAALDPLNARVAVGFMESLAAAGDVAAALRHARLHEALLREELQAEPDAAVAALAERLRVPERTSRIGSRPPTQAAVRTPRESLGDEAPVVVPAADREVTLDSPGAGNSAGRRGAAEPPPQRVRRRTNIALVTVLLTALTIALLLVQRDAASAPDSSAVVVVPFDVADPELALWREGLVDVLSRNLDGAGPLRAISPTLVVRKWNGHADQPTVRAFASATHASFALFGQLLRAGPDSVRASVTLLDVRSGEQLAEFRRQESGARMDRLTDSLTVEILSAIGRSVPLAASRAASLGRATSFEALRAFLQGEQFFRRAEWDSAVGRYRRAVAADTTFALAWRRLGLVASWQRLLQDSLTSAYLLRAGAANTGLGPRDSLLVAADSLAAAATTTANTLDAFHLTRRLFSTLDTASRRYPTDPEVWFALGEARYHFGFGPVVGVSERATLAAFDSAIALDSAFAPAYIHPVELGFNLGGAALGLRYARAYLARNPTEDAHRGVLLIEQLVDPRRRHDGGTRQLFDTAHTSALVSARTIVRRWPDSAETAVVLSRALASGRPSEYPLFSNVTFMRKRLAEQLAFRGHFSEAYRALTNRDTPIFAELAYLDAVPVEDARTTFARWARLDLEVTRQALAWWSSRRDTASLAAFARRATARLVPDTAAVDARARVTYDTTAAAAHLALARGDSTTALRLFLALPDTLCPACYLDRLTRARLLASNGRDREAAQILAEPLAAFLTPVEVVFALDRARAARRMGDIETARECYRFVLDAWSHGDATLHAVTAEAAHVLSQPTPVARRE